ncbi:MAG: hypothetical protein IKR71_06875 [Bacteroidales bacterium]|nr:hypothetical protein [Bacteroidales bacterium]
MKINLILTIIALALAALIGILIWSWCSSADNATAIGITTAATLALTLIPSMGLKLENGRMQTNIRVLSVVFALIFLIVAVIMCFITSKTITTYYVIEGIFALIFILILYSLLKTKAV